jgi:hypothetical protein
MMLPLLTASTPPWPAPWGFWPPSKVWTAKVDVTPGRNCAKKEDKSENSANWPMKPETARLLEAWVAGVAGIP